jgi:hypothetical protein
MFAFENGAHLRGLPAVAREKNLIRSAVAAASSARRYGGQPSPAYPSEGW